MWQAAPVAYFRLATGFNASLRLLFNGLQERMVYQFEKNKLFA
jgi:hypothetical protein